ncbi:toprim domain-containing protein [Sphingobium sp. AN641]|uniref:toprim domain-containing protein n=1 Tax=Sphingobium sp. AN641 TaxID=3133443 RepID=UPI0030C2080B
MEAAGVRPVEPIADRLGAGLVRFACEGDGKGKLNGWAVLHLDGCPAGAFGNYRLQVSEKWRAGSVERLTPAERRERAAQYRAERDRREAIKLAEHQESAERCRMRWDNASPADPAHPYLVRKHVAGEGIRQNGNRLLVPMFDADGALWNLQAIAPNGSKRFTKGGRQRGLSCLIGQPDAVLMIGEGFATCAAARRATGHAVAMAFSAKNLTPTALTMQAAYPDCDLVILADDDAHLIDHPTIKMNVGLEAARAAALAVGGCVAVPPREATI